MPLGLFIFLAVLAVISSLGVILERNPVHSLLWLVMTLLTIAVLFIALGATVLGFLQAIVYVGAILVLFLFVIWLLDLRGEPRQAGGLALKVFGALAAAALVAELMVFATRAGPQPAVNLPSGYGGIEALAALFFSRYLVAFEATSLLLLVAVVGAVALARRASSLERKTVGR